MPLLIVVISGVAIVGKYKIDDLLLTVQRLVEESTATSQTLARETQTLAALVRRFRIEPIVPGKSNRGRHPAA